MASMQVPVKWTRSGNVQNGVCTLDLSNFKQGNILSGTWGNVSCSGTVANYWEGTEYDGVRTAWEVTQLNYLVSADNVSSNRIVCSDRKRIWFGADVTISQSPNIPLVAAKSYKYTIYDTDYNYFGPTLTHGYYTTWNMNPTVSLFYEITTETPTNLKQRGTKIYEDIYVDFTLLSSNAVEYEVVVDDVVTIANTTTSRNIMIPAGTIKDKSKRVKVNIKSKVNFNGTTYYSPTVALTLGGLVELVAVKPTNLRLVGTLKAIEEPMLFAWDVNDTAYSRWLFEIWQDGIKIYSVSTIKITATIPPNTLKSTNSITVKVKTSTTVNGYTSESDYISITVSGIISLKPVIKDFSLDSNNLDYDINIIPDVQGADWYRWSSGSNNATGLLIRKGNLSYGLASITLYARKNLTSGGYVEATLTKEFNTTRDNPIIYSLEPDSTNINITEPSLVSFTVNEFADKWWLKINGVNHTNGTIERSVPIAANIFVKGTNTLELTLQYKPSYYGQQIRQITKGVSFTGYGEPSAVTHDDSDVYGTAKPTFTWYLGTGYGDDQVAYSVEVREKSTNKLIESDSITSSIQAYTVVSTLVDSTEYIVKIKIKNKYELWSEWSVKDFMTSFSNLTKPLVSAYANGQNIILTFEATPQPLDFKEIVIMRKEGNAEWIELGNNYNSEDTITDYTAKPATKLFYKCRMFNTEGAYIDSNIVELTCDVETYTIMPMESLGNQMEIPFTNERILPKKNTKYIEFAGNTKPIPYTGTTNYRVLDLEITCTDEELEMLEEVLACEVICYKSYRGIKAYVNGEINEVKRINYWFNKITVKLTEVHFIEKLMYAGNGFKKLTYMNDQYYMDGVIDMSGVDERGVL